MRKKKNINTLIKDAKKIVQVEKVEPITSLGLMHLLWIVVLVGLLNLFSRNMDAREFPALTQGEREFLDGKRDVLT